MSESSRATAPDEAPESAAEQALALGRPIAETVIVGGPAGEEATEAVTIEGGTGGGTAAGSSTLPLALAMSSFCLSLMATYTLWVYARNESWPQAPAAIGFSLLAYFIAGIGAWWLGRTDAIEGLSIRRAAWSMEAAEASHGIAEGPVGGEAARATSFLEVVTEILRDWRAAVLERPATAALMLVAVFLSITVGFTIWARGDASSSFWDLIGLWSLSIAIYTVPLLLPHGIPRRQEVTAFWEAHREALIDAGVLVAAALVLRATLVGSWPDILGGDEGLAGNVARSMLRHTGNPFSTSFAYGNLYHLVLAAWVRVLGPTATALRLPSAIAGSLAVGVTYLAGRQMFDRRVGLLAAAMLGVSHMHIHMSRTAHGQAIDTLLAAWVLFTLARGIRLRHAGWMALAGVGLGLAQHFYVGARVLDVVALLFVTGLLVLDRRTLRSQLGGLVVAFGAAFVVAAPMIVWAIRRPGDYLTRLNATGVVQTGAIADRVGEGAEAWKVIAGQIGRAIIVPFAYPAVAFYDASIAMLDLVLASLVVLGVLWAVANIRDWRYLLLLCGVVGGVLVLALGNLITIAAYRVTVAMPFYTILAAVALVAAASGAARGFGRPAPAASGVALVVLAGIAGYNLAYTYLVQLPACRYLGQDAATAAVSIASAYIADTAPDALVFAVTEPQYNWGAYPNGEYLIGAKTKPVTGPDYPPSDDPAAPRYAYSVPPGYDVASLVARAPTQRPLAFVASPKRVAELDRIEELLPGGRRDSLDRCGVNEVAQVYVVGGDASP